ncbi:MAG: TatD family hydrolase [Opitutaceae bacterium]|jgi:TatD DNase family protein|nr:TatD family hydrolase [Opitutaceae bacterium]
MELIDTHTHLESFDKRGETDAVLARAAEAGVGKLVTIGTSTEDWARYRGLAARHAGRVFYTAGLHPCSVDERWSEELAELEGFWHGEGARPVALGECGLDRFHLPKDDAARAERVFAWQRAAFAAQLVLAKRLGCPLVVHSRGAFAECVAMIDASGVAWERVVFHCFTEGAAEMGELVRRGGRGSFTGVVTYKNAETVRDAVRAQGVERLMLETDAPYLAPTPHRGKTNEPAYLRHTAEAAADALGLPLAELAEHTTRNARAFFEI